MSNDSPRIMPLGESAVVVEFGSIISAELNQQAIAFANHLTIDPFIGFVEAVPAYSSTTVFYDLAKTSKTLRCSRGVFDSIRSLLLNELASVNSSDQTDVNIVEIAARFGIELGPDLDNVAS